MIPPMASGVSSEFPDTRNCSTVNTGPAFVEAGTWWTRASCSCRAWSAAAFFSAASASAIFCSNAARALANASGPPAELVCAKTGHEKNSPITINSIPMVEVVLEKSLRACGGEFLAAFCCRHSPGVTPNRFLNIALNRPRWR